MKRQSHCNRNKIHFVTTYSRQYNQIVAIVKKCLPILYVDKTLYDILQQGYSFSSRRAPTLGSILSPSLFHPHHPPRTWLSTTGSFPCGTSTCRQCRRHRKTKTVTSFSTGKTYTLKHFINCSSKSVVYVVECSACQIQYVGCTIRHLRIRVSEHYNDTVNPNAKNISNVSKHFKTVHGGNLDTFSFFGLEHVKRSTRGGIPIAPCSNGRCGGYTC